jgi:hypothetical protein
VESWAVLLRDLPAASDPVLGGLLEERPIAAPLMHTLARVIRALVFRIDVTGIEHLPESGAGIVSPNHQSYLDPFLLCAMVPFPIFRRFFFVGAVEYFETPLTKRSPTWSPSIPIRTWCRRCRPAPSASRTAGCWCCFPRGSAPSTAP